VAKKYFLANPIFSLSREENDDILRVGTPVGER
jgi:hypothetical protein